MQGWATDFIPKILADAVERGYIDEVRHVSGAAAMAAARDLAAHEGIASGISGGGALAAALELAAALPASSAANVAVVVADGAERYISTPLFDAIPADMTDEERAIAESTPSRAPPAITLPEVNAEAVAFVEAANAGDDVVVWSLENCEFCWTIFKLFDAIGVKYRAINIDAFEYAEGNRGNQYRSALASLTDCNTFPQCFIGGAFMGGAADACIK
mmetsp:Transcript_37929/g.118950  ORF Transcript_37929/g.118950 Transcript_37929/m.118950 type:complete len:216 (+) Transcript_37929:601-1248(+)